MSNSKRVVLILILVSLALALISLSGCMMGMTKQQRLDALSADIEAGVNTRSHFLGHPNTDTLSGTEFLATAMRPVNNVDIIGTYFEDDNFEIYYVCTAPSGTQTATGTFYDAGDGKPMNEDWYIRQIDPGDGSDPIPVD